MDKAARSTRRCDSAGTGAAGLGRIV